MSGESLVVFAWVLPNKAVVCGVSSFRYQTLLTQCEVVGALTNLEPVSACMLPTDIKMLAL